MSERFPPPSMAGLRGRGLAGAMVLLALLSGALGSAAGRAEESLADRRQRVQGLSAPEKEELRRRQERFSALDPAEQDRLRSLHRDLEQDPQAEHLRQVMQHYHKWLLTLPPYRRSELLELAPVERVERIKTLVAAEQTQNVKRLNPQDAPALWQWMEGYGERHEKRLMEYVSDPARKWLQDMPPAQRHRMVFACLVWQRGQQPGAALRALQSGEPELATLRAALAPETRQRLEGKPVAEQWRLVVGWIRQAIHQQAVSGNMKPFAATSEEELISFFEGPHISDEQRDYLLSLPPEEMQRKLRGLYLISAKQAEQSAASSEHPGRAKKAGAADASRPRKGKKNPPRDQPPTLSP